MLAQWGLLVWSFYELEITDTAVVWAEWLHRLKQWCLGIEHGAEAEYKQQVAHTCRLIAPGATEVEAPLTVGLSL